MKLKAKLGAIGKAPPLTPRRTPNPRRTPKTPEPPETPERGAEASPPEEGERENPEIPGGLRRLVLHPPPPPPSINREFPRAPERFRLLKRRVAQTLASLDPDWIERCRETPKKREIPAGGAEGIPGEAGNSGRKRSRGGEGGDAAEAPAKRPRRSEPGVSGARRIQAGESWGAEGILGKEGKAEAARGARSRPRNSGNFVRLNLKRKIYSRASLRGKFLRKQVWKRKWRQKFGAASGLCFRCGGDGHWAAGCPGKGSGSTPEKLPEEEQEEEIPTLEEAARRNGGESDTENPPDSPQPEFPPPPPPVAPLYPPNADGTVPDPPEEVLEALRILGYESFRPGQAEAVMRVLSGISTLVVLPTGTGKSLCYQLPALLHHRHSGSICLVISPLVSLMDDQVSGLPSALRAVCVHSNMSQSRREEAVEKVKSGRAQILLLSPESLTTSGAFSRFCRDFPPVAFACLDEVHCISQWSHNFRPAYLRVCKGRAHDFLGVWRTFAAARTSHDSSRPSLFLMLVAPYFIFFSFSPMSIVGRKR